MSTSAEIRQKLVETLAVDLVGPGPGHPLESEQLWEREPPSRWYLTGFLVPSGAPEAQRFDPESVETIDAVVGDDEAGGDDDVEPDQAPARKVFLPCSMGISVLVPRGTKSIDAVVFWGDYHKVAAGDTESDRKVWQRKQQRQVLSVALPPSDKLSRVELPNSRGVCLYISARDVTNLGADSSLQGTRAVSVFVVNERDPASEERVEEGHIFQVELVLKLKEDGGFVPRPNLRGHGDDDADERIADLQYRDAFEFAVGHGIATHAVVENGKCFEVRTCWIPTANVEKVDPTQIDVELSMEKLGEVKSQGEAKALLGALSSEYATWIKVQRAAAPQRGPRGEVSKDLLNRCELARKRIEQGIDELADAKVLEAFRIANRTMALAARQRNAQLKGWRPDQVPAPKWRPFQLAFLLMNLRGIARPSDAEREVLDLLFFPTGGGKTEAYLGLAAFTLVLRRLRDPSITSSGVSVLMRYTLRLLTLDQLGRAATLVCALELERQGDIEKLGKWPFEIGLWVGRKATPNRIGRKGDNDRASARARTIAFQNDSKYKPAPIPIENCPWCGTKFEATSFRLTPNADLPADLRITCANEDCAFTRDNPLPIIAVDEPLYRRLPCFIIATVDKIASLPWLGPPGKLFGKVDRYDASGFYGPSDGAGSGSKLSRPLPPPDLIIQDELHLISGPLGTMVGLYETAVEALCWQDIAGKRVLPKIIASTATVRRAEAQVRALFGRTQVDVFPPPGPDRRDSFFAETVSAEKKNPRLYVGIAAQGRSLKVVLLRSYLALLSAAKKHYDAEGGAANASNPTDPYMTLVGYFNALRELGGSRRIVEDEVRSRLQGYFRHRRLGETDSPFVDRTIQFEAVELTSREPTNRVAQAKRRLALPFAEDGRVDVALATNMISVGLDITRLGLMVVLGQPKTSAEYIQATSRVGRDEQRPGLVITLLNIHKPRDRSHYERFEAYHETFYRAVEATSVTPFAPRAVDRGLAAVVVALARHGEPALTPAARAAELARYRARLPWVRTALASRAENHAKDLNAEEREELSAKVGGRVDDLLDAWEQIAAEKAAVQAGLQYGPLEARPRPPLLHDPLDPDLKREPPQSKLRKFKAQWSLRDVESEVPVIVRRLDGGTPEAT